MAPSSTELQAITGLERPISASLTEVLHIEWWLLFEVSTNTQDGKLGVLTAPPGAVVHAGLASAGGNAAGWMLPSNTATLPVAMLGVGGTVSFGLRDTGVIGGVFAAKVWGGGNAGNVVLGAAQNTAEAATLKVLKGSLVKATKAAS